jgi:xanthine dehydrogenase accessory factor
MSQEVLVELVQALERGEEVALVTIVAAQGSTPQRVGAKMLVYPDGRMSGTIGGGCYENDALGKAREALLARKPRLVKYDLTDDFAEESGLICGGQMTVYIEPVEAAPQISPDSSAKSSVRSYLTSRGLRASSASLALPSASFS